MEIEDKLNTFVEENKEMINTKYGTENEWSFKIKVEGFGRKYTAEQQKEIMLRFGFMDILQIGKVDLSKPDIIFWIIEEIGENQSKETLPKRVMFARQVSLLIILDIKEFFIHYCIDFIRK